MEKLGRLRPPPCLKGMSNTKNLNSPKRYKITKCTPLFNLLLILHWSSSVNFQLAQDPRSQSVVPLTSPLRMWPPIACNSHAPAGSKHWSDCRSFNTRLERRVHIYFFLVILCPLGYLSFFCFFLERWTTPLKEVAGHHWYSDVQYKHYSNKKTLMVINSVRIIPVANRIIASWQVTTADLDNIRTTHK